MLKTHGQPVIMSVAGFDPSGGAGVLADIKTIAAFGCYGVAAITSLTFQDTRRVFGTRHQSAADVRRQIKMLLEDFDVLAIKTGVLPTPEIVSQIARVIEDSEVPLVVVDPVFTSTSGFSFCDDEAVDALRGCLLPLASLVTPNTDEALRLAGRTATTPDSIRCAAEDILRMGARAVLVTGGDLESEYASDVLLDAEGTTTFNAERIVSRNTHGTGCALSSAIACLLAKDHPLREAVQLAKDFVSQGVLSAQGLGHGHGPLNHFPPGLRHR